MSMDWRFQEGRREQVWNVKRGYVGLIAEQQVQHGLSLKARFAQ